MLKKTALFVLATLYSGSAYSICTPQDFLKSDTVAASSNLTVNWSKLSSMSREEFEEQKRNGHLWLSLPKVPLITTIDYDDFKKLTLNEASREQQQLSLVQTQTIYRSSLSTEGTKAYIACLQSEGEHLDISAPITATDNPDFFVALTWYGPRGTPDGKFDNVGNHHFQVFGGEVENQSDLDKIESIRNGKSIRVKIKRDLSQPFGFSASVNGSSSEIGLPPKSRPTDITLIVVKSKEQSAYGDGLNAQHQPICMDAADDEIFLPSTLKFAESKNVPSNGKAWTDINGKPNEKNICATVHAELYPGRKRPGAARITSHIEVLTIKAASTGR